MKDIPACLKKQKIRLLISCMSNSFLIKILIFNDKVKKGYIFFNFFYLSIIYSYFFCYGESHEQSTKRVRE